MSRPSILLLGATGFIGRNLAGYLRSQRAWEVLTPGRSELDFTATPSIAATLRHCRPSAVINCTGATGIGRVQSAAEAEMVHALNVRGPAEWARACADQGVRFVHLSTDQVFGGEQRFPYTETDEARPVSEYGRSKREGELAVLAQPSHLVIRTSFVFGRDGNTFMSRLPRLLAAEVPVTVATGLTASVTAVSLLVGAVADLLEHDCTGLYHVANEGESGFEGFATRCAEAMVAAGFPIRCGTIQHVPYASMEAKLGPRARYSVLRTDKAAGVLGRRFPPWTDELPAFVRACLAHHPAAVAVTR